MSKARIYGLPSRGKPNNRRDTNWKEKKPMDCFKQRSDMATPCKDCPTRYPGCRATCQNPDFLKAVALLQKAKLAVSRARKQEKADRAAEHRRDNFGRTHFGKR